MQKEEFFILSNTYSRRSLPPLTGNQLSIWERGHLSKPALAVNQHLLRAKSHLWNCGLLWVGEVPPGPAPSPWHSSHLRRTPAPVGRDAWLSYLPAWKYSPSSAIKMSDCISDSRAGLLLPGRGRTREPLEREENHMLFLKGILSEC